MATESARACRSRSPTARTEISASNTRRLRTSSRFDVIRIGPVFFFFFLKKPNKKQKKKTKKKKKKKKKKNPPVITKMKVFFFFFVIDGGRVLSLIASKQ
jgi:hypothetical protein